MKYLYEVITIFIAFGVGFVFRQYTLPEKYTLIKFWEDTKVAQSVILHSENDCNIAAFHILTVKHDYEMYSREDPLKDLYVFCVP
jgi:hypothetical protein